MAHSTGSGQAIVDLAPNVISALLAEAAAADPYECCGVLLGTGATITQICPAPNIHPTPRTHFEIDPQALIDVHRAARNGGPQVLGYFHSHPRGSAHPSATDRAMAAHDGKIWAIAAGGDVRMWRDAKDSFVPLSYAPVDG